MLDKRIIMGEASSFKCLGLPYNYKV